MGEKDHEDEGLEDLNYLTLSFLVVHGVVSDVVSNGVEHRIEVGKPDEQNHGLRATLIDASCKVGDVNISEYSKHVRNSKLAKVTSGALFECEDFLLCGSCYKVDYDGLNPEEFNEELKIIDCCVISWIRPQAGEGSDEWSIQIVDQH